MCVCVCIYISGWPELLTAPAEPRLRAASERRQYDPAAIYKYTYLYLYLYIYIYIYTYTTIDQVNL